MGGGHTSLAEFYAKHAMRSDVESCHLLTVQLHQLEAAHRRSPLSNVVDLGAGGGASTANAMRALPDTTFLGVDISSYALREFRRRTGANALRASLDVDLPFGSRSVDAVICDDVIEHLVDPDRLVHEVRRILRPGGHLFLTTPNLAAWFNRGMLALGRQPVFSEVSLERVFGRPGSQVVGHLRLYTKPALVQFLEHHGFQIEQLDGAGFDALPSWLRSVDRAIARAPGSAAILVCWARRPRSTTS